MAQPYGLSFQPGAENPNQPQRPEGPGGLGGSPLASVVRLLSLRLPTVLGAQAPAPGRLLQSPGSQGINPQALLWLQRLLGGGPMGGPMGGGGGPMGGPMGGGGGGPLPAPRVEFPVDSGEPTGPPAPPPGPTGGDPWEDRPEIQTWR
jgi:hypothetical protein